MTPSTPPESEESVAAIVEQPKRRAWQKRALLSLGGLLIGLMLAEVGLRWVLPMDSFITGYEWKAWNEHSDLVKKSFVADAELGFHPRLNTSDYDRYGALILGSKAQPIAKDSARKRVVFLGDSVTARRAIEKALKKQFGETSYEYWNCGVEGYNTYQEVKYYQRFCGEIKPDHVILTLHNNDYHVTPVAFYDDDDRMAVISPDRSSVGLNPLLYRYSYIYRVWFSWRVGTQAPHDDAAGAKSIRDSLAELRGVMAAENARLTVLVLPICTPEDEWDEDETRRHERSLEILAELKIQHFDLRLGLRSALEKGVDVQENKDDKWHPSPAAGTCFVEGMVRAGFEL